MPSPKIFHNQISNNELNELQKNTWEAVMKLIYKCICRKDWDYTPLHAPCNKDKNMDKRMVKIDIIWHARCAGQCNIDAK
jgi:hypothetical protein